MRLASGSGSCTTHEVTEGALHGVALLTAEARRESPTLGVVRNQAVLIRPVAGHRDALPGLPAVVWPEGPVSSGHDDLSQEGVA